MDGQNTAPTVIKEFLDDYRRTKVGFEKLANFTADKCRTTLRDQSVACIVTSRAKNPDRLRAKLLDRAKGNDPYQSKVAIYKDIVDLAGVRIALYFPKEKSKVDTMINAEFDVQKPKQFTGDPDANEDGQPKGYKRRFPGYSANHYRVLLKKVDATMNDSPEEDQIEIQIVSVLRHAWAEVEHDSVYKELTGPASLEEHRIIDGLGGVIHMGECFLDQLCDTQELRDTSADKPFESIYELGFFISKWIHKEANRKEDNLGSIKALKKLLEILDLDKRKALEPELRRLDFNKSGVDSDYKRSEAKYEPIKLTASTYIMDHIIWSKKGQNAVAETAAGKTGGHDNTNDEEEHLHKLRILASTMIWLDELFPPFSVWNGKLKMHPDDSMRKKGLTWLGSSRPVTLLKGPGSSGSSTTTNNNPTKMGEDEMETLDKCWDWFESHPERAVQFAFRISKLGILRDFEEEMHLLMRAFLLLNETLKPM